MTNTTLDQRFADAMGQLVGPQFPETVGLAVSGGGDSMAMLALAHNWARVWGVGLRVVTIDHQLRVEIEDEAAMVARETAMLGHSHDTLRWKWDGQGNVQDRARRARLELLNGWRGDIEHVLMAHTADDIAENFLMRLSRGSGVDGLSAMTAKRDLDGMTILRPCLDMTRSELRHHARTLRVPWAEDPSNDDPKYDRAKARAMLPELAKLGLHPDDLTATAGRMRRAREALHARMCDVARGLLVSNAQGVVVLDRSGFAKVERETQLRLLASACMWVGNAEYRPRADSLEALLDRLLGGGSGTLIGAKSQTDANRVLIFREFGAVYGHVNVRKNSETTWDGRWSLNVQDGDALKVGALGHALQGIEDWRRFGLPRAALMSVPGVFQGEKCIAAPTLTDNSAHLARIVTPFTSYLLSH